MFAIQVFVVMINLMNIGDKNKLIKRDATTALFMHSMEELIKKYNVPVPRYTSYPTVPFWSDRIDIDLWKRAVLKDYLESKDNQGISLYIHLPYCESLCTYCACNTRITKNHGVEKKYIHTLLREWHQYVSLFEEKPVIEEIHLGGGTPTFFSPENLKFLIRGILETSKRKAEAEFSFEGHPNNTTRDHLMTLHQLGFQRVSFGVQDLDYKVQKTINRIQPYENLVNITEEARAIGYHSINYDLVYGLPFQSDETVAYTIDKTIELKPERIAYYSYAHVPWKRPGQRAYDESDLPNDHSKRRLYETGKRIFLNHGYSDVGMDHFALPGDSLYKAWQQKRMNRNFMGYTTANAQLLIGLGCSAISDAKFAFAQNEKNVEAYISAINEKGLAISKGYVTNKKDRIIRKMILDIACNGEANWKDNPEVVNMSMSIGLHKMADEGLIQLYDQGLVVTELGMVFLRNICSVFDEKIKNRGSDSGPIFSKAI
jgi:oxygen-independent coproporphyrinogen-3 oxidase